MNNEIQQPDGFGNPLPFPYLPDNLMVEEQILPPPVTQETEPVNKKQVTKAVTAPLGSVLLHKQDEWEARLTPMNRLFVFNALTNKTSWPFLDKKGLVKFGMPEAGAPPEAIEATVKRILNAKRSIRQQHHDDFTETTDQYSFS